MGSRTKGKSKRLPESTPAESETDSLAAAPAHLPSPPKANKRLLQVSAILLLLWFGFLAWMALFS